MIKLVASDLDGTIIDKNNYIYENNLKAINDLNNHKMNFVIYFKDGSKKCEYFEN